MIGLAVTINDSTQQVAQKLERAVVSSVGHAAASLRKRAIESIQPSDQPSPSGKPPHTRLRVSRKTGKVRPGQLQRAIVFDHDKTNHVAVIGPRASVVGQSGKAHEFGGAYKGGDFPQRPFMGPALDQTADRFGDDFAGSLGQ
ncbi:MAG TPA: hypothetical protein VJ809_03605 [Pirellulales bacterium]|nr:hypothetical protein [Pirellulales bacterium]